MELDIASGFTKEWLQQVKEALAREFGVEASRQSGFQVALWPKLLSEADDVEKDCLPSWMEAGFPLGASEELVPAGVFPLTEEDIAAVEASRAEGVWM